MNNNDVSTRDGQTSILINDLRAMIDDSKQIVAITVNKAMTMLYWQIGIRINQDILGGERAKYGKEVVLVVSKRLYNEYGRGFSEKSIRHMIRFADVFPDKKIVSSLMRQLSWSHFLCIIYLQDDVKREFYSQICSIEKWSTRTLRNKISSMLYERTALSKKPEELTKKELNDLRDSGKLSPDLVFRDPYILDFLGLTGAFFEKDLENAILRELEAFILEIGIGFTFVTRQKRITIDGEDFYIDLLFFHRRLKCLVAIELKIGDFKPEYKGKMELYLRWLDKYEKNPGENQPLGIIICAGKRKEQIELLKLDDSGIHVAEYLLELPPLELFKEKLHRAIEYAREKRGNSDDPGEMEKK